MNTATVFSSYQHHATSYMAEIPGFDTLHICEVMSLLHAKAHRLAPRFAEETAEAGNTNLRPSDAEPRRQMVWDMLAESLGWNLICDDADVVAQTKALLRQGKPVVLGMAWNFPTGTNEGSYQQSFVIDLNGNGSILGYSRIREIEDGIRKGEILFTLDAPGTDARIAARDEALAQVTDQGWVATEQPHSKGFGFDLWHLYDNAAGTTEVARKARLWVTKDARVLCTEDVPVPELQVGDIIHHDSMVQRVAEVQHYDSYAGTPVTQARGPVLNHAEIAASDPWLARYIDASNEEGTSRRANHWWTVQGNELAKVVRDVVLHPLPVADGPMGSTVRHEITIHGQTAPEADRTGPVTLCQHCAQPIERQPGVGWVLCEIGGTYDACEGRWNSRTDSYGTHRPIRQDVVDPEWDGPRTAEGLPMV